MSAAAAHPPEDRMHAFTSRLKLFDSRLEIKSREAEAEVARSRRAVQGFAKQASESRTRLSIKAFAADELDSADEEPEDEPEKSIQK